MVHVRERIKFIKTFTSDKNVGAIAASSRFVARSVIKYIPQNTKIIVECGPGEGGMTRELLKCLPSEGMLFAIEANKEFATLLRKIYDARLTVVEGKVQDITRHAKSLHINDVDFAVASIPFSFVKPSERTQIVRDVYAVLKHEGVFVIFNYSPLMYHNMKKIFGNVTIALEARNVPPCFIMVARK